MTATYQRRTTRQALDALQLLINNEHRLHIPVQPNDADVVLGDVIAERDALRAGVDAARDLADWLPGVWADYQAACRADPDATIPSGVEQLIHTIQTRGFTLRDALAATQGGAVSKRRLELIDRKKSLNMVLCAICPTLLPRIEAEYSEEYDGYLCDECVALVNGESPDDRDEHAARPIPDVMPQVRP